MLIGGWHNARQWLFVAAALAAMPGIGSGRAASNPPIVRVKDGALAGTEQRGVHAFLGIPYAAPPVGTNRWRAPQPVPAWQQIRRADHFGSSCLQAPGTPFGPWTREYQIVDTPSENCLFLNVWTPVTRRVGMPVLVWIHGGAFTSGSGSVPIYDGAALAGQGVIVVTINYRLGIFGFFAHPELEQEAGGGPIANFGLQDQIAALRWVHANIAAFGGDPAKVTIAGQSAGAFSVHALTLSPLANGLFRGAIIESGLLGTAPMPDLASAERAGVAFANARGAPGLQQLRALPAGSLGTLPPGAPPVAASFGPVIDGRLIVAAPGKLMTETPALSVPMIVGMNADEGSASPLYRMGGAAIYDAALDGFGSQKEALRALYPAASDDERLAAIRALARDRGLASIWAWEGAHAADRPPVWAYLFDHPEPGPDTAKYGAFHSSEIPYALATLDAAPERPFTDGDRRLSVTMSRYWLDFVRTGNPNGAGLTAWPALTHDNPRVLRFGATTAAEPLLPPEKLAAIRRWFAQGGKPRVF